MFTSLAPLRNELPSGIQNLRTSFGMVKNAVASLGPLIVCLPMLSVVWYRLYRIIWNFRVAKITSI
ncbi:hypothetical protein BDV11DRAFT_192295 [Aspergillus similis]